MKIAFHLWNKLRCLHKHIRSFILCCFIKVLIIRLFTQLRRIADNFWCPLLKHASFDIFLIKVCNYAAVCNTVSNVLAPESANPSRDPPSIPTLHLCAHYRFRFPRDIGNEGILPPRWKYQGEIGIFVTPLSWKRLALNNGEHRDLLQNSLIT